MTESKRKHDGRFLLMTNNVADYNCNRKIYVLDSIWKKIPKKVVQHVKMLLFHEAKLWYNLMLDIERFDIFLPHVSVLTFSSLAV